MSGCKTTPDGRPAWGLEDEEQAIYWSAEHWNECSRYDNRPADRLRYEALKRKLAKEDWTDMNAYARAKSEFVEPILARALEVISPLGIGEEFNQ